MRRSIKNLHKQIQALLSFMADYRSGRKIVLVCTALAGATCALIWLFTIRSLDNYELAHVNRGKTEARAAAATGARTIAAVIDTIDDTIVGVQSSLKSGDRHRGAAPVIHVFPIPGIIGIQVSNSAGTLQLSNSPARQSSLASLPQLELEHLFQSEALSIWPSAGAHAMRLHFARSFLAEPEAERGLVSLSVTPEFFSNIGINTPGGRAMWLAIIDRSGRTLIASPALSPRTLARGKFGSVTQAQLWDKSHFRDGRARFVETAPIAGYPLSALIGVDFSVESEDYSAFRTRTIWVTAAGSVAAVAVSMLFIGFLLTLAWRKQEVTTTQETYRMATEGSNEGFFIVEVLLNSNGSVEDFTVVDCNRTGAAFCNKDHSTLVGQRFSQLYGARNFDRIDKILSQAYFDSSFEGEAEFYGPGPMVRWMFIRAVRSSNRLAVTLRDISESKAHLDELQYKSTHDSLTGLPNRLWLLNHLPSTLSLADESGRTAALLFIDLDGFKMANDTMGHAAGDELLQHVAHRLKDAVRPHDNVVRIGGDEFVIVLQSNVNDDGAAAIATRIITGFRTAFTLSKGSHNLGASIGIAMFPRDGNDAATLLQNADVAMYSVKTSAQKGTYRFFEPKLYDDLRSKATLDIALKNAIQSDQFEVYYQPRLAIDEARPSGMEALIRWNHPTKGCLSPALFISLAEENGTIIEIGLLVLRKVCTQLQKWGATGSPVVPISINVSPRQFQQSDFAQRFCETVAESGVPFHLIEIELTESAMMAKGNHIRDAINLLRAHGIKLIIDDFGTGYSSLAQLQEYSFDVLKVDKAFTDRIALTAEAKILFSAIVAMAHGLGMSVVAEGVEDATQLEQLKQLRCDEIQGFLISHPLAANSDQSQMFKNAIKNFENAVRNVGE